MMPYARKSGIKVNIILDITSLNYPRCGRADQLSSMNYSFGILCNTFYLLVLLRIDNIDPKNL